MPQPVQDHGPVKGITANSSAAGTTLYPGTVVRHEAMQSAACLRSEPRHRQGVSCLRPLLVQPSQAASSNMIWAALAASGETVEW